LRNLGSKVQKFKNYLSELQKLFTREFLTFCGTHAPLSLCRIWLESVEIFRVKRLVACFAPIFRPNYAVPCVTAYISGTKNLRRLKLAAFLDRPEYNRSHPRHRPHRPPCGKGTPSKIGKKSKFSKIKPSLAGSGGKCFRDFRQGGNML